MIKIAILGVGRMGTIHARNAIANPRLDLAWLVDPNGGEADRLAEEAGARRASLDTVLADPTVRGVLVASPTSSHLDDTLACLNAGKAVFCEKPLSLSCEDLLASEPALTAPGLPPLFIAFNRRFDPHIQALKAQLDAGAIGKLESLHLISHDPAPPPPGFISRSGGLFRDFTIHDFDTAAWLMDSAIVELFASASCLIDPTIGELGDLDTAKLILRAASGTICAISNNRRSGYGYDQRIEAFGSKGALTLENLKASAVSRWEANGPRHAPILSAFPDRYAEAYRMELDHFADIIDGREPPRTGYGASRDALRLADAAELSARTGRPIAFA